MKRNIFIALIIGILLCTAGCSNESIVDYEHPDTAYIYNLSDKSTRTFTEPYTIRVGWSPDSQYFSYNNFELKNNGIKIRRAKDLEVIQSPMDKWKYSHCSYSFYWNKDSDMVVEIKGKGDFWFKPGTKTLSPASKADKEENITSELTKDQANIIKKRFGLPDEKVLICNDSKTRFYYFASAYELVFCNMITGEKEITLQTIYGAKWSWKGDKVIYSVPKAGFDSINNNKNVYEADLFETFIYDFNTKEKTKIADFKAMAYCSPDEKYIILMPEQYIIHYNQ